MALATVSLAKQTKTSPPEEDKSRSVQSETPSQYSVIKSLPSFDIVAPSYEEFVSQTNEEGKNAYLYWLLDWLKHFVLDIKITDVFLVCFTWALAAYTLRLGKTGQAQVRAYVTIKSATIEIISKRMPYNQNLISYTPKVSFIPHNSGQSPARRFVYEVFIKYPQSSERFAWLWQGSGWEDIAAHSDAAQKSAWVVQAPVSQEPVALTFLISFRYYDVFDQKQSGEAYFSGANKEDETWEVSPIFKPQNWD